MYVATPYIHLCHKYIYLSLIYLSLIFHVNHHFVRERVCACVCVLMCDINVCISHFMSHITTHLTHECSCMSRIRTQMYAGGNNGDTLWSVRERVCVCVCSGELIHHFTHMNESCCIHGLVMSHVWSSHVTYMNESCHTYERVMSHI